MLMVFSGLLLGLCFSSFDYVTYPMLYYPGEGAHHIDHFTFFFYLSVFYHQYGVTLWIYYNTPLPDNLISSYSTTTTIKILLYQHFLKILKVDHQTSQQQHILF